MCIFFLEYRVYTNIYKSNKCLKHVSLFAGSFHFELMLPFGTVSPTLAKGTVYLFRDGLICSIPLLDNIYGDYHYFFLPVSPIGDVNSLGRALHGFI